MTPITDVFMLSIDSKLDYELLKQICMTGHSRVPVYEDVDVPVQSGALGLGARKGGKAKKIVGILLVKQCVLLDPKGLCPTNPTTTTNNPSPLPLIQTQYPCASSRSTKCPSCPRTCPSSGSSTSSRRAARTWPSSRASASRRPRA